MPQYAVTKLVKICDYVFYKIYQILHLKTMNKGKKKIYFRSYIDASKEAHFSNIANYMKKMIL